MSHTYGWHLLSLRIKICDASVQSFTHVENVIYPGDVACLDTRHTRRTTYNPMLLLRHCCTARKEDGAKENRGNRRQRTWNRQRSKKILGALGGGDVFFGGSFGFSKAGKQNPQKNKHTGSCPRLCMHSSLALPSPANAIATPHQPLADPPQRKKIPSVAKPPPLSLAAPIVVGTSFFFFGRFSRYFSGPSSLLWVC